MRILIAGDGKVGATLTRQLSAEGHDLILIDSNQAVLESSEEQYDVLTVRGNCASMSVLREAGVQRADLLIAATSTDEMNLLCCLTAHGLNPALSTIARIRDPEYLGQVSEMRELFGLSLAVNPEKQAALEISRLIEYPGFLKRDTFAKSRSEIVELRLDADSRLCGLALSQLPHTLHCQVLVCAVLRDGCAVMPGGDFVLRAEDRIFVTADAENLSLLLKNLGVLPRRARRALIAGGGRVGYYLAQKLLTQGVGVKVVERSAARCEEFARLLPEADVLHGDASSRTLLESEGLGRSDALVTLTGMDELNIILSLYGIGRGVPQVITKLGRAENLQMLSGLHLGSVVCPKELCCSTIVRYVRAMQNQVGAALTVHSIADGQAEAVEFLADGTTLHCGEPLRSIRLRPNVLIAGIARGAQTEIPNGSSCFYSGDTLIVVTGRETVLRGLNDIFN